MGPQWDGEAIDIFAVRVDVRRQIKRQFQRILVHAHKLRRVIIPQLLCKLMELLSAGESLNLDKRAHQWTWVHVHKFPQAVNAPSQFVLCKLHVLPTLITMASLQVSICQSFSLDGAAMDQQTSTTTELRMVLI